MTPDTIEYLRNSLLINNEEASDKYELSIIHRIVLGLESTDLETVLSVSPYSVINSTDSFGKTALLWAARRGDAGAVQCLLKHGADPNMADTMRRSALHLAARSRSVPVIEALIKYGADPSAINFLNEMPAHYACYEENSPRLLKPFLDAKIDVNQPSKFGRTLLDIAVQWNYPVLVDYLITKGASTDGSGSNDWTQRPLGRAIMYNTRGVLEVLLKSYGELDFVDDNGNNIWHFAAEFGNKDTMACLRDSPVQGYFADVLNNDSASPMDLARSREDDKFVKAFEAVLNARRSTVDLLNKQGQTPCAAT